MSTYKWTCGECGESYEASGVVADLNVDDWARKHREEHRVAKLSPEAQREHYRRAFAAQASMFEARRKLTGGKS